ncbi:hypothetical protein [Shinella kummerowiae]|uniref:hypothetical protein n=1 Tax=Shinella kummerowiae TaxID=417745 RepID=UPI001FE97BA1|nr:hypothetical protein [Shinella kummerowiae]
MSIDIAKSQLQIRAAFEAATSSRSVEGPAPLSKDRLALLAAVSPSSRSLVDRLLLVAGHGLPRMYDGDLFAHTLRAVETKDGWTERREGVSLRYTAMTALGLAHTDTATQMHALEGGTIAELLQRAAASAEQSADIGAIALTAWAIAEVTGVFAAPLYTALSRHLASGTPISTVECAWCLSAALAARGLADTSRLIEAARAGLFSARLGSPLFGHWVPASASGRLRSHIGCFADQVYPIQALSRLHASLGDVEALTAAEVCAERICALQGSSGQWWWHYDVRHGTVAEGYPVYSVHQHAMAPMALLELREAGGRDFFNCITNGLRWLDDHPETRDVLIVPDKGVVWRKVARREPNKFVRKAAAAGTALWSSFKLPAANVLFPPRRIDRECRPYEFGLMLYAWLSGGTVTKLGDNRDANTTRL